MRTYRDIDPGLHPEDLADCLTDLANEYMQAFEEDKSRGRDDVARMCYRVSFRLHKAAESIRRLGRSSRYSTKRGMSDRRVADEDRDTGDRPSSPDGPDRGDTSET